MSFEDRANEERGLLRAIVGDGVPLLLIGAGSLVLAGGFALFLVRPRLPPAN